MAANVRSVGLWPRCPFLRLLSSPGPPNSAIMEMLGPSIGLGGRPACSPQGGTIVSVISLNCKLLLTQAGAGKERLPPGCLHNFPPEAPGGGMKNVELDGNEENRSCQALGESTSDTQMRLSQQGIEVCLCAQER